MQNQILFKTTSKPSSSPIVILTGPAIEAQSPTTISTRLSRALSSAWTWTRCNCAPRHIVRSMFSAKVSLAVAIVVAAAIWWHNISIADMAAAQKAVGFDCLLGMPWAFVWTLRAIRKPMQQKGGDE